MKNITDNFKNLNYENIFGLTDELKALYVYNYFKTHKKNIILLVSSLYEANKFFNKIKTFTDNVLFFPMDDFLTSVAIAASPELKAERLYTLDKINEGKANIIVTNLTGYLRFVPSKNIIEKTIITIKKGDTIKREKLVESLIALGYNRESMVTSTGEFSVRGYVIDIFPFRNNMPIRIETFGNDVESIRLFDQVSQLKIEELEKIKIFPFKEIISKNHTSLYELLENPTVFKIDYALINKSYYQLQEEIFNYKTENSISPETKYMYDFEDIHVKKEININDFDYVKEKSITYQSENIEQFKGNINQIKTYIERYCFSNQIKIVVDNNRDKDKILEFLSKKINLRENYINNIKFIIGELNEGFILENIIYLTKYDLFNVTRPKPENNLITIGTKIKTFSDINKGDYVVHVDHGIGIYGGVKTLSVNGFEKDFILIEYKGTDKVYVPVEKITTIFKYSDKDSRKPKINQLAGSNWEKTKNNVKEKILDIYNDLVKLYDERTRVKVPKYISFNEEEKFADEFIYEETPDQIKCIKEINDDLSTDIPMDRLLCGDVGYGKTEVAFRAMFKTVMNGFQVAYLCPTTILSNQQYKVAKERFKSFNLNIRLLNRFTSEKDTKKIMNELEQGKVDIIFGTHKLLNKHIKYFDLGLLVIDEEQRFGVMQKEKIKEIKTNVNVLTLSATPIPRTLKMSMSGLKDLSLLDTPPKDRYPIQTYVIEENDVLMKDIIYKEMSRNGQVYFLYNDVKNIEKMYKKISALIPDAKISYAHGQMSKEDLEDRLESFVNKESDVLICSTIIETGMDIPNVNSLIIIDAQNFGLSQLYQLRGRVGRSTKIGYCYLMYSKTKTITETATKRLKAIKEFTELGSGYKIALRDLSIRGAGDLLGREQAGYIDSVGFNLYTQMFKEVMDEIKGEKSQVEEKDIPLINVDTHISKDYIYDENIRIEIHNLINNIYDFNSFDKVKTEIEDRFGKINEKIEIYMYEEWFEKLSYELGITNVKQTKSNIEIFLPKETSDKIDGEILFFKIMDINSKFKIRYQSQMIIINLDIRQLKKHFIFYLVSLLEEIVRIVNKKEK